MLAFIELVMDKDLVDYGKESEMEEEKRSSE